MRRDEVPQKFDFLVDRARDLGAIGAKVISAAVVFVEERAGTSAGRAASGTARS